MKSKYVKISFEILIIQTEILLKNHSEGEKAQKFSKSNWIRVKKSAQTEIVGLYLRTGYISAFAEAKVLDKIICPGTIARESIGLRILYSEL